MNKEIPGDWKWVKIGDICKVVTGTTPPKSDKNNYGNEYPFFKPPHLWDGNVFDTDEKLSDLGSKRARIVPINTVLVTCIGNLGRTGFVKAVAGFNQQINAILENDDIIGKYIFYLAQSPLFRKQLESLATGTTVSIVNKSNFETITIPLPPPSSQQAIVSKIEELFSDLDKGIENLKTVRQQLKVYRQSVLKWAFEGKLTNDNVEDGELPDGWKWVKMGDVIQKPKYGTSKKCGYQILGKGVIRIPNITKGLVDITDLKFAAFDKGEIETYRLEEGDILTIRSNGSVDLVGKCALVTKRDEEYLFAGYLIRLRPLSHKILPKYLINTLSSIALRNQIEEKAKSTSGVNNINSEELSGLIFSLPPLQEQLSIIQEIESRLSVADKMEETITQSLLQAEALRQSILKKAFEGKLV